MSSTVSRTRAPGGVAHLPGSKHAACQALRHNAVRNPVAASLPGAVPSRGPNLKTMPTGPRLPAPLPWSRMIAARSIVRGALLAWGAVVLTGLLVGLAGRAAPPLGLLGGVGAALGIAGGSLVPWLHQTPGRIAVVARASAAGTVLGAWLGRAMSDAWGAWIGAALGVILGATVGVWKGDGTVGWSGEGWSPWRGDASDGLLERQDEADRLAAARSELSRWRRRLLFALPVGSIPVALDPALGTAAVLVAGLFVIRVDRVLRSRVAQRREAWLRTYRPPASQGTDGQGVEAAGLRTLPAPPDPGWPMIVGALGLGVPAAMWGTDLGVVPLDPAAATIVGSLGAAVGAFLGAVYARMAPARDAAE